LLVYLDSNIISGYKNLMQLITMKCQEMAEEFIELVSKFEDPPSISIRSSEQGFSFMAFM